jgi:mono/diheme cytochrome c family protein
MRISWVVGSCCVAMFAACSVTPPPSKFTGGVGGDSGSGAGMSQGGGGGGILGLDAGNGVGVGGGADVVVVPGCTSKCGDFPSAPIFDTGTPATAASMFPAPTSTPPTGLCIVEPVLSAGSLPGALYPANWARVRFRVKPANNENLFEIRLKAASQTNELVAYTTSTTWLIPTAVWAGIANKGNAIDQPITVTIRGVNSAAPGTPTGGTGTFTIAPVTAGGSMVYWATQSSNVTSVSSKLVGFYVGDENTIDTLTVPAVAQAGILDESGNQLRSGDGEANGAVACIGCHQSTPDGNAVGFVDDWPWDSVFASIEKGTSIGSVPTWMTAGAQRLTQQPWMGMMTMSGAHWKTGDRIALITYENRSNPAFNGTDPDTSGFSGQDKLAWFDLETTVSIPWTSNNGSSAMNAAITAAQGTAWGLLTLTGETAGVISPNWSHDGSTIVYTSASQTEDGRIGNDAETDIHMVPYNNHMGGTVTPVPGASTPGISEYYPSFSADDKLLAYNRAGNTTGFVYYRPDGEVYIIPKAGGTPTRLAANDPPACAGETSPGIINSWAKWSPTVVVDGTNGNTYYWLIFSSARDYPGKFTVTPNQYSPPDHRSSQLYMTGIVIDKQGAIHTYPAVYLYNQDPTWSNLTPAWNQFNIPPPPPTN